MKVLILAGGYGTRLSEETDLRPKPMVEIGGKPILWHIMKIYSHYGFNDFVILLGYKGYHIKEYFANYYMRQSDVTFDMRTGEMQILSNTSEPWRVTLVDTGLNAMTGARIKQATPYIGSDTFLLTYGDGVSDVDIAKSVEFHKSHGKLMTMTAIQPEARFGNLDIDHQMQINHFIEKPKNEAGWINGGFFVCDKKVLDYIDERTDCVFEQDPLRSLAKDGEMMAFRHEGFWQPMDTLRDKQKLNDLWSQNKAPWKVW